MNKSDFSFELPPELIAQFPLPDRTGSRLLCVDSAANTWNDAQFSDLGQWLRPNDLLVFNNTQVIPARLFGVKATGGVVEMLFARLVEPHLALLQIRASKSPKPGSSIYIADNTIELMVEDKQDDLYLVRSEQLDWLALLETYGKIPLPPYIERAAESEDLSRYQTVYAEMPGAVAAPTAGLHFDEPLLAKLKAQGISCAFLTLHVGAGTFQPVRTDNILDHKMHFEYYTLPQECCDQIAATKAKGGRVIAVGTTSVRTLESAAKQGELRESSGSTNLFIYPGYEFKVVDAIITNFHLSESTLLMLISAFANRELILQAYQHAIEQQYRFFSYGDAMFIHRGSNGI